MGCPSAVSSMECGSTGLEVDLPLRNSGDSEYNASKPNMTASRARCRSSEAAPDCSKFDCLFHVVVTVSNPQGDGDQSRPSDSSSVRLRCGWIEEWPALRPASIYSSPDSVDGNNQYPCEERSNARCSSKERGVISRVRQTVLDCSGYARFG